MEHPPQFPAPPSGELVARNGHARLPAAALNVLSAEPGSAEGELLSSGLVGWWRLLRRRRATLFAIAFLGTLAALLFTLPQTPVYQARTSLEIQDLNENFLNIKQVSPVSESGGFAALTDLQTQMKILQSESLLERVLARLNVARPRDLKPETGRLAQWRRALNLPEPPPENAALRALRTAAGNLRVRAAGQTRIIEVFCDSTDPRLAAKFANTLANEFIDQNMEARWKMNQRTGEWLTRQLDDMRVKLERSEDALQSYARQSGLMFTSEKNNLAEEKLRQLQEELSRAQADRVSKQSRYEMARNAAPDALPDALKESALRDYDSKLTELRRQQADLNATYTARYSRTRRTDAQVAALEAAVQHERGVVVARIHNEYEEAMRREKLLLADYGSQSRLVTQQAGKGIQYNILRREVDSNRQLYESMLQQVKETAIASAMRSSNIRVIDPARTPRSPYKPRVLVNSALGMLAGIFAGVVVIITRERANRSLQEPGDIGHYLHAPELGMIPSAASQASRRTPYGWRKGGNAAGQLSAALKEGEPPFRDGVELITWQRKPSMIAESFRAVLTSILFSGMNGNRPRVLVLASSSPAEGKTTVVSNLSIALAEIGQRVLLVDADMRKPRLHEVFDIPNDRGLGTLLEEPSLAEPGLNGVVRQTFVPGLFLLASGPARSSAANLLHSPALGELVARFRREFDMVLIDTPPMLQMPDARVIGRLADAVVLVARAGHTTRDAALAARQRFADDGIPLLGVVLNHWDPKSAPGGYYGYYGGAYSSSYAGYRYGGGKE